LNAFALFVLITPIFLAPPAAAQGDAGEPFVEVIDVRVVNLEVVVVDRDGNRVSGLGPEDFRLRVDKREVPIDFFNEVRDGVAVTAAAREASAPAPAEVPGIDAGEPVGTSYLVFIDDYFSLTRDRNVVLEEMLPELSRLGPEDRVAVVSFNGRKLHMFSSWSSSAADLQEAFRRAMARPARGLMTRTEVGAALQDLDFGIEHAFDRLEKQVERVSLAATAALRSFAQPPGRKVMLLLSGGWPYELHTALTGPSVGTSLPPNRGAELLAPIYETANLLGYTLYPVDVGGDQHSLPDAGRGGLSPAVNYQEAEVHQSLKKLANETGGRPLLDGARLTAMERVIEDVRSYYWLGFTPDWQGDDENHEIRLEVLRPGLEVRHREGFQDMSREKEVSFMVESVLLFGDLPGAHPLRVGFGEPRKAGAFRLEVPIAIAIPMDEVTMVPTRKGYEARLELRIAVLDEGGHRNQFDPIPVVLDGDRPPEPGEHALYQTSIRMRKQLHDVVVTLHDPLSGTIFAASHRLAPTS